ncbi:MAG: cytochrome b [Lautropia sp.]
MPLANTPHRYGAVTKLLHWTVLLLFLHQYVGANLMTRVGQDTVLGMGQNLLYDWHKSIGLVILVLMVVRTVWRNLTPLPAWSPLLTENERRLSHRLELFAYLMLLALPLTGYLFVMAGDYGVNLFSQWRLPNPIGKIPTLANWSWFLHVLFAYVALVVVAWHVGHVLKKHIDSDGRFLQRMLPFRRPG